MKKLVVAVLTFCSSACVHSKPIANAPGLYTIRCNGTARTMADCYEEAVQVCKGSTFTVIDRSEMPVLIPSTNPPVTGINRNMIVSCENSKKSSTHQPTPVVTPTIPAT